MHSQQLTRHVVAVFSAIALSAAASAAAPPEGPAGNVTDARVAAETNGDNWLVKGGSFA